MLHHLCARPGGAACRLPCEPRPLGGISHLLHRLLTSFLGAVAQVGQLAGVTGVTQVQVRVREGAGEGGCEGVTSVTGAGAGEGAGDEGGCECA